MERLIRQGLAGSADQTIKIPSISEKQRRGSAGPGGCGACVDPAAQAGQTPVMCNLYRLDVASDILGDVFSAEVGADPWTGGYVAPGRPAPVVLRQDHRVRALVPRIWGVPPPPKGDRPITNIRNLESPFWIGTLRHVGARCLVPVTRFQEWGGRTGARTQHWFSVPSQPVFAFAGICRDSEVPSFAFLTTAPNPLVGAAHPKAMPLVLHREDWETWLTADWKTASRLVAPFPSQLMREEDAPQAANSGEIRAMARPQAIDLFSEGA